MTTKKLIDHPFVTAVFDAVRPVLKAEQIYQQQGQGTEDIPDEFEFYIGRLGNRLAILVSLCEQLSHAILFMSNYRQTPSMKKAGITRADHIRYSIENYIIRTQTLYDLTLKLIDAVFHLLNSDSQCRHATIVQNLKVKNTKIPDMLKTLRKKLKEFEKDRHKVIHHGSYQDKELKFIEMCSVLQKSFDESGNFDPKFSYLPELQIEFTREFLRSRKAEYLMSS